MESAFCAYVGHFKKRDTAVGIPGTVGIRHKITHTVDGLMITARLHNEAVNAH